eukprot:tig00001071_g6806.t1
MQDALRSLLPGVRRKRDEPGSALIDALKGKPTSASPPPDHDDGGAGPSNPIKRKRVETSEVGSTTELPGRVRHRNKIHVKGSDVPDPIQNFSELPFKCAHFLARAGFQTPTAVQMQAIPIVLAGRDVIACAPTGSGKTLAFALPILGRLAETGQTGTGFRAVVVSPTRELAQQIYREFKRLRAGAKYKLRIAMLTAKPAAAKKRFDPDSETKFDVLITTPLRLQAMIKEESIDLSLVEHLVLDEADKLLELGFLEQVDEIVAACGGGKPSVQRCLFSATMPPQIEEVARSVLVDPINVTIGVRNATAETVRQRLVFCGNEHGKLLACRQLLREGVKPPVLIFVQSKERAVQLLNELRLEGIRVEAIHSDLPQHKRNEVVKRFRSGSVWVLIATDLLARGMDFKGVNCVVNYDMPQSVPAYIHRIGRSGRAGRQGEAVTLYTEFDRDFLRSLANVISISGGDVPEWMRALRKMSKKERKWLEKHAPHRPAINAPPNMRLSKYLRKREAEEAAAAAEAEAGDEEEQAAAHGDEAESGSDAEGSDGEGMEEGDDE